MTDQVDASTKPDHKWWPDDQPGYVFLLRAIQEIGRAICADEWTGEERLNIPEPIVCPLPEQIKANWNDRFRANSILIKHRPDFNRQPVTPPHNTSRLSTLPTLAPFSKTEWEAAQELIEHPRTQVRALRDRYLKVARQAVIWLRANKLVSALRPIAGGRVGDILAAETWLTEKWPERVTWGSINALDPYQMRSSKADHFIFVTRESLDHCLRRLAPPRNPTIAGEKLCEAWLKEMMSESPQIRARSKVDLRAEAVRTFKVSKRGFDRTWDSAIEQTGSAWNLAGAPKKSSRQQSSQ